MDEDSQDQTQVIPCGNIIFIFTTNAATDHYLKEYESFAYDNYEIYYAKYLRQILNFGYIDGEGWDKSEAKLLLEFAESSDFEYLNIQISVGANSMLSEVIYS